MSKKKLLVLFLLVFGFLSSNLYALDKAEVKKNLLEMNMDDLNEISEKQHGVVHESARNTGYAKGYPVGGGGGFYFWIPVSGINDNKPSQVDDVKKMYGGAGGFLVNISPRFALGGLFGGFGGGSSKKVGNDYWDYSVGGAFQMLQSQYKPVITDKFILGIDTGIGFAESGYTINQTDEKLNGQDIERSGHGPAYLFGIDLRRRLNPMWHTGLKIGYMGTNIKTLKRADFTDSGKDLNLGGYYFAICMGGNF